MGNNVLLESFFLKRNIHEACVKLVCQTTVALIQTTRICLPEYQTICSTKVKSALTPPANFHLRLGKIAICHNFKGKLFKCRTATMQ
ncbi:hypothetical protein T01_7529 [Trichinella spiralis]|uniref:Uncharacterized protein n=1 Tax=Trichinella spiralis TaxID=6334 RepID=A0A0V1BCV4_TRISP|nr:hypothetical protein T01_7529 [Trichinella spiralis]